MHRFAAAALAAAIALPSVGCSAEPPADKAFGDRVRAYLLAHPEVIAEAIDALKVQEAAKEAATARTAILDHRRQIERDPRDPVAGAIAGKVTVTQFFDYRCPYCKVAGGQMQAFIAKHPNVRFVFKEFPILSAQSEAAARLALAANLQGKYLPVHTAFMTAPNLGDDAVDDILRRNGVDVARAKQDAKKPEIEALITENQALARTLGVNGTPAFVVGERISNGWAPEELDAAIAEAEKGAGSRK